MTGGVLVGFRTAEWREGGWGGEERSGFLMCTLCRNYKVHSGFGHEESS